MENCKLYCRITRRTLLVIFIIAVSIVGLQAGESVVETTGSDILYSTLQQIDKYKDTQPDRAIGIANEYIKSIANENKSYDAGMVYLVMGRIHENKAKYLIALKYYQKALSIFKQIKSPSNVAEATFLLAKINKKIGLYEEALVHSLDAIDQFEKRSDSLGLAGVYNVLGSIYKYQDDHSKAIEYYQRFHDISIARNNQRDVATALNNIGVVYDDIGNFELAKCYYEQCIVINEKIGKEYKSGTYYSNIGELYLAEGNFVKAKECFDQSYVFKKQEMDIKGIAVALGDLGKYYWKVDSLTEALSNYEEAIRLLSESGSSVYLKNLYYGLHKVHLKSGDYQKAYENYKLYHELSSNLVDNEVVKKLSFWEWNQKMARQKEIEQFKKERNRLIITVVLVVLSLLILFILTLYQRQKNKYNQAVLKSENEQLLKEKVENKLEIKNKELTIYSLQVAKTGEISNNVIQKLERTKYNLKKDDRYVVQSVINELQLELKQDKWKEFEICFSEVYDQFYSNLTNVYPNLTPKEIRLCAFLRMNMSSKDIASITGQTPHSINIARTRLRKKMNLTGQDVDLVYFLAQY